MAIGSISSGAVTTGRADPRRVGDAATSAAQDTATGDEATIADHVASVDEQEPIRSASTTLGTMIDTYL